MCQTPHVIVTAPNISQRPIVVLSICFTPLSCEYFKSIFDFVGLDALDSNKL